MLSDLEDAELYSMMADEHFTEDADRQRQALYRAHFKMQRYILSGDAAALEAAADILDAGDHTAKAVASFLELFPQPAAVVPGFRVQARMKLAYLSGEPSEEAQAVIDCLLANAGNIPAKHPMQQILPYAIMLCQHPDRRRRLQIIFDNLRFPPNIIKLIRDVLALQIIYQDAGVITDKQLQAALDSVPPEIAPQWRAYGLGDVLSACRQPTDHWRIGPMAVLPFNYA